MKREFVMTEWFESDWKSMHLSDQLLRALQEELMENPLAGSVMRATGGFRKMRFALTGRGKSGSMRVIYLDVPQFGTLYLMMAYPKNEKDSLSPTERNQLKRIAETIKENLQKRSI